MSVGVLVTILVWVVVAVSVITESARIVVQFTVLLAQVIVVSAVVVFVLTEYF